MCVLGSEPLAPLLLPFLGAAAQHVVTPVARCSVVENDRPSEINERVVSLVVPCFAFASTWLAPINLRASAVLGRSTEGLVDRFNLFAKSMPKGSVPSLNMGMKSCIPASLTKGFHGYTNK